MHYTIFGHKAIAVLCGFNNDQDAQIHTEKLISMHPDTDKQTSKVGWKLLSYLEKRKLSGMGLHGKQ